MARTKATEAKAAEAEEEKPVEEVEKKPAKAAAKKDPAFKVEKLRANCVKLFGITSSTFDGAFYGNTKEELTIEEARAVLNKWLGRKE